MSRSNDITLQYNRQAFLALAKDGFKVFPVTQKKRPLVKWKNEATDDLAKIDRWLAKWPDAMPAIATGAKNGIAAFDFDLKDGKDGAATLRALGLDPDTLSTVVVQTLTKVNHLIFRPTPGLRCSAGQIGPGVDVRAERGLSWQPGQSMAKGSTAFCRAA